MKKVMRMCLTLLLGIMMTVNVLADTGVAQYPDYVTDYYMIVESPDGGIDFYVEASFESSKLNNELIPNGTAFHIEGEVTDANNRVWGYSKYHGMTGYICEDNCRMVTRSEAIKSELSIAETAEADYEYTTVSEKILYNGPGEKFGKVANSSVIPSGTTVHIVKEAKLADGSYWGYTSYQYEGWITLESLVNIEDEDSLEINGNVDITAAVETDENSANADIEENAADEVTMETIAVEENDTDVLNEETEMSVAEITSTPTPEPTATSTPTPEPTATNTPMPEPTATNTPTPEPTATDTPTPEPTATDTPTPEVTATTEPVSTSMPTVEPTETTAPTEAVEEVVSPTVTEAAQAEEVSSSSVEKVLNWYQSPIMWIAGICILLVIIVFIYHFIKKNK